MIDCAKLARALAAEFSNRDWSDLSADEHEEWYRKAERVWRGYCR